MPTGSSGSDPKRAEKGQGQRMSRPFFTVLMNAYNGADYIAAAIESVLAQTERDFELLIWDDCSTDETGDICRAFGDPRIRYIRADTRVEIGPARDHAIALATGEWIAFLDQDDLWLPEKLAQQRAKIEAGNERLGLVYGRTVRFGKHGLEGEFDPWHRVGRQPEGDIFRQLLRHPSFVALSSACVRTAALHALGGIPDTVRYAPDYWIFVNIARGWRAACVQTLVCRYRVHGESMSHIYARKIHEEGLRTIVAAARPGDQWIVRRRRRVTNAIVAMEEMRRGHPLAGAARLISSGSFSYFFGRPVLRGAWRPTLRLLGMR